MKFIYSSDQHGHKQAYEHLFKIAKDQGLPVILGGDLTPKRTAISFTDKIAIPVGELGYGSSQQRNLLSSVIKEARKNKIRASQLEERGYVVWEDGVFSSKEAELEQRTLEKVVNVFEKSGEHARIPELQKLNLSKDELDYLQDVLLNFKEYENVQMAYLDRLGEKIKSDNSLGRIDQVYREELLLSNVLPLVFKYGNRILLADRIKLQTDNENQDLAKLAEELLQRKLSIAAGAVRRVSDDHVRHLFGYSHVARLRKDASDLGYVEVGQRDFLGDFLKAQCHSLQQFGIPVFAILGNDDMPKTEEEIKQMHEKGHIAYVHNAVHQLPNGLFIAGYNFVPSTGGKFHDWWEKEESKIAEDLEALAAKSDSKKTIYVIHCPPAGTHLDINYEAQHIGSTAVRAFVERHQPLLVLSGHVHESRRMTRVWQEKIGDTICVNPGGNDVYHEHGLHAVIVDTDSMTLKHTQEK